MSLNRITLIGFNGQEPKTFATQAGKEITRLSWPPSGAINDTRSGRRRRNGTIAFSTAVLLSTQPISPKEHMSSSKEN